MTTQLSRAQGCWLGQLAGDALGSLVEFETATSIKAKYPNGVRHLADGGCWGTLAGQPTDDSEMALALARTLVAKNAYDTKAVRQAYLEWLNSPPFDIGGTTRTGLAGGSTLGSQANGALMRISPLGIFGARPEITQTQLADWARQDARQTHQDPICQEINTLFVLAIADAIRHGTGASDLYAKIKEWAKECPATPWLPEVLEEAAVKPPASYQQNMGWVRIAFHNALWQLLHAPSLEAGVVDTVMRGGDTDTTAAIAGALLGAVHGREAVPAQWTECILSCRPAPGNPRTRHPRPECYWPCDALELATKLSGIA
jgi:ADP-ribosylglycohydrolase